MPKYVLHYFDKRARGELIRLALTFAGQDFEDHTFTFEEWPKIKQTMPAGLAPVLEEDGKVMNESLAIARYVARKYGFGGKTDYEQYQVDRVLGAMTDLMDKMIQEYLESDATKKAQYKKTLESEIIPRHLDLFEKYLEDDSGFFVGKAGSLADLAVHNVLTTLIQRDSKLLDKHPKLRANRKATESLPRISEYLAKRPVVDM